MIPRHAQCAAGPCEMSSDHIVIYKNKNIKNVRDSRSAKSIETS